MLKKLIDIRTLVLFSQNFENRLSSQRVNVKHHTYIVRTYSQSELAVSALQRLIGMPTYASLYKPCRVVQSPIEFFISKGPRAQMLRVLARPV